MFHAFTNKTAEEVLEQLGSAKTGLSDQEAVLRQKNYGFNELKIRNINAIKIFFRQVQSPFFYILILAARVAALVGERIDGVVIISFVFLNTAIGFFQEFRAERVIHALKKFIPVRVKVLREGEEIIISGVYLVPGDVIRLEAGDNVPADLRILEESGLAINESNLTGESVPSFKIAEKHEAGKDVFGAKNIAFSGTSVVSGDAKAVVIATGKDTVFASTIKQASETRRQSALEKNVLYFCKIVLRIVVLTIILIFVINLSIKGLDDFLRLSIFSVALIVSILPEALPAVVTFALARGGLGLAKRHVVVKRLSAVEDMGNIEVLCTDKTGTLTQNKLSLEKIVSSDKDKSFLYGALGLNLGVQKKIFNPFDAALYNRVPENILRKMQRIKILFQLPFDSYRMMASILVQTPKGGKILVAKGSPEVILERCTRFSGRFQKKELQEDIIKEGAEGSRVLALACKKLGKEQISSEDEKGLTFLGYFVFKDPLKTTAREAVDLSRKLGIKIKVITGDSLETTLFVAQKAGLASGVKEGISGRELLLLSEEEFDDACIEKSIFARVSPDLKQKIIRSLQKRYEVGFMGEGVNDAPALMASNVGIAVAEASDAARDAADVILLQKDLRVIINGIKSGRNIYANINKYIKCSLASNFGNFYSIAVISLFVNYLPMLPVQILLGNILSDFPLVTVATDSVDLDELRRPKMYQLHMFLPLIILLALVSTIFDFIFFSIFYKQAPAVIQTLWFIESIITEILLIYIIRTKRLFYKAKKPAFWLLTLTILDAVLIVALPYTKIGQWWFHFVAVPLVLLLIVFVLNIAYFVVSEAVKLIFFRFWRSKQIAETS